MMKQRKNGRWHSLACAVTMTLASATADGAELHILPMAQDLSVGQSVEVEVLVAGLGDGTGPSLGAYDLALTYDPELLAFTDLWTEGYLEPTGSRALSEITSNDISSQVAVVSMASPAALHGDQPSEFTLFRATFEALAPGQATFDLEVEVLGDADGRALAAEVFTASATLGRIAEIPTLSTGALVALVALLGFAAVIRLRRTAR